jgi:hypothetical protein
MKGEQDVRGVEGAAGSEQEQEQEGRNLLNKFIGAQILLAGVEPLLKAAEGNDDAERRTVTTATVSKFLKI